MSQAMMFDELTGMLQLEHPFLTSRFLEKKRELNVHLAVDVSGSMVYGSPVYKGHLANLVAGSLAFACARNRDNVSLCHLF